MTTTIQIEDMTSVAQTQLTHHSQSSGVLTILKYLPDTEDCLKNDSFTGIEHFCICRPIVQTEHTTQEIIKMSSLFEAITEDVLDTLRLKPWWEVAREYSYRVSLAIVALFAISPNTKFSCVPSIDDNGEQIDLTDVQAEALNPYCKEKSISTYLLYADLITLAMVIVIYIVSNYWLHIGGVKDKLTDLSELGRSILELNMTVEEMQILSALPITASSTKEQHTLRSLVLTLLRYRESSVLSQRYSMRCGIALLVTVGCSIVSFIAFGLNFDRGLVMKCEVLVADFSFDQMNSNSTVNTFACVDEISGFNEILIMVFAISLALQSLCMVVALSRCKAIQKIIHRFRCNVSVSSENEVTKSISSDLLYFLTMMMSIGRTKAGIVTSFACYILEDKDEPQFKQKLYARLDEAVLVGDAEYFRILKNLVNNVNKFWRKVTDSATHALWDGDNNRTFKRSSKSESRHDSDYKVYLFLDNIDHIIVKNGTKRSDTDTTNESELKAPHERAWDSAENHNWYLLSCSPFVYTNVENIAQFIKFNRLDEKGRSFLYYVLRRSSMDHLISRFGFFNKLMKITEATCKNLVHFDGKSMDSEDFFFSEYPEPFRGQTPDFRLLEVSKMKGEGKEIRPKYSETDPKPIRNRFRSSETTSEVSKGQEITNECEDEYNEIRRKYSQTSSSTGTASSLNNIKLIIKLENVREFGEKALKNKDWEVFVALLNAFTVVYKRGVRPEKHDLVGKDTFSLANNNEINEIFKEALKRPRNRMYFVPTAAEHILSVVGVEKREELVGFIDDAPLPAGMREYLKHFANKTFETR